MFITNETSTAEGRAKKLWHTGDMVCWVGAIGLVVWFNDDDSDEAIGILWSEG